MEKLDTYFLGIDLHKSVSTWVLIDSNGRTITTMSPSVKENSVENAINRLPVSLNQIECAIEPVGCYRSYIKLLEKRGLSVTTSNPSETPSIAKSVKKTDKKDAKELADLLRSNRLNTSYVLPEEMISLRDLSRERTFHVHKRSSVKSRIAMVAQRNGYLLEEDMPKGCMTNIGKIYLKGINNKEIDRMYRLVEDHNVLILEIEREIENHPSVSKNSTLLQSIPGIGKITAAVILAEIGDVNRFSSIKKFQSYSGLVPKLRESAEKSKQCGIHKRGPVALRTALVEAACRIRKEEDGVLLESFKNLSKKTKSKMEARTALARKLVCIIYGVLKTQTPYKGKFVSLDNTL
jgi:transposase